MGKINGSDVLFSVRASNRFSCPCVFGVGLFARSGYGMDYVFMTLRPFGATSYGETEYGDMYQLSGIYIDCRSSNGFHTAKKGFYSPKNPRTEKQYITRNKFADAIAEWQNLTNEQKLLYNRRAYGKHMSGYNLKISEYMSS